VWALLVAKTPLASRSLTSFKSLVDESYEGMMQVTANAKQSQEPEMEMDISYDI
jgi:hypothetical protein